MTYRLFIVSLALMFIGGGLYYLFQEKHVAYSLIANKKEKSDLLDEQIRRVVESDPASIVEEGVSTTTPVESDAVAGEILAGNYSSETGIEVIIQRNKKAILIAPANPISKGKWEIISNNILSITITSNGIEKKHLFSIEDPAREIVEIIPGETVIYTRK